MAADWIEGFVRSVEGGSFSFKNQSPPVEAFDYAADFESREKGFQDYLDDYEVWNTDAGGGSGRVEQADYNDPFGPAGRDQNQKLRCLHCEREFTVGDVKWEPSNWGIWVCPSWPKCDGAGIGFDLHPVTAEETAV
jgi:hypothetical protein